MIHLCGGETGSKRGGGWGLLRGRKGYQFLLFHRCQWIDLKTRRMRTVSLKCDVKTWMKISRESAKTKIESGCFFLWSVK